MSGSAARGARARTFPIAARVAVARTVFAAAAAVLAAGTACLAAVGLSRAVLVSPPSTPILEYRDGSFLSEGAREYTALGYWELEGPLNPLLVQCMIQIEDSRFFEHPGVDLRSVARAIARNAAGAGREGGSTIAMQVARLQRPAPRTAWNKLAEMSTAICLVGAYGRDRVLRHYLRIVPQGNEIFGVAYAARRYFGKPLSDLGLSECAILASLPREPGGMNLFSGRGFARARARATLVVRVLESRGLVPAEAASVARASLDRMERPSREDRSPDAYHFILKALEAEGPPGSRSYSRPSATSLDPAIQALASRIGREAVEDNRRHEAGNAAVIVADRATGEILAYAGSCDYFDPGSRGMIDYAAAPRSSGSVIKPLLFAYGLHTEAFTPASVLADLPFAVLSPRGEYRALNFDDDYLGPMLYRRALANSRNVPALRVLEGVGLDSFLGFARRLGFARDGKGADHYGYSMAIGGLYVTLVDLVAAYGALANDGRASPLSYRKGGRRGSGERILSSYSARLVMDFLSDPSARFPSFSRSSPLDFPFPVAAKTGTSQGYRDAWTVAVSDRYIVGMWMGNPDNRPMNGVAGMVCASYAGRILRELSRGEIRGLDVVPFPPPEGTTRAGLCSVSGLEAGPYCPTVVSERFEPGREPRDACRVHRRVPVDGSTGALADAATSPGLVAFRNVAVLPPEYALWGAKRGLAPPPRAAVASAEPTIRIEYPPDGGRYAIDPSVPLRFQSIPLQALVHPRAERVVWWVDGAPAASAAFPYAARLPLVPGRHRIVLTAGEGSPSDGRWPSASIEVE